MEEDLKRGGIGSENDEFRDTAVKCLSRYKERILLVGCK